MNRQAHLFSTKLVAHAWELSAVMPTTMFSPVLHVYSLFKVYRDDCHHAAGWMNVLDDKQSISRSWLSQAAVCRVAFKLKYWEVRGRDHELAGKNGSSPWMRERSLDDAGTWLIPAVPCPAFAC